MFKKFLQKSDIDYIYRFSHSSITKMFVILFLINLVMFFIYNSRLGMFFVDSSREVYVPMAMNDGYVLYKDIFNVYAPLGYQLNAFLTSIFGENLRTFYYIGFLNATIIMFGLFLIARFFFKDVYAFYTFKRIDKTEENKKLPLRVLFPYIYTCFITICCFYSISLTNYIFPYSYSMVFALNTFIWSLLSILYFYKKGSPFYLYSACLLYGASFSFKYEFLLFGIVIIFVMTIKKTKLKTTMISLMSLICVPLISLFLLIPKGVTINDLHNSCNYIILLAKSLSAKKLYTFLGFFPSIENTKELTISFIKTMSIILYFSIIFNLLTKNKNSKSKFKILKICVYSIFIFVPTYFLYNALYLSNAFYFNWIGVVALVLYIYTLITIIKHRNNLTTEQKLFFILYTAVIAASVKCIFNISFNSYGTYYFPLLLLCILVFFEYNIKNEITKNTFNYTTLFILTLFTALYYCSNINRSWETNNYYLLFDRGTIAVSKEIAYPIINTVEYIKKTTKEKDTVLVLPEGAMINFLTNRQSNNKYYYLIPPNIEIFGEENIVKDLEKNLPDYIVLQPMSYLNFRETYFCESFGTKICTILPKYYEKPIVFGKDFWIAIYKKRNINKQ